MGCIFGDYIGGLSKHSAQSSSEMTYRADLEILLNAVKPTDMTRIEHERRSEKMEYGRPDFTVLTHGSPIGFIETKRMGDDLEEIAASDQIKRYQSLHDNILLTDYCAFIVLKEGVRDRVDLCRPRDLVDRSFRPSPVNIADLSDLLQKFFSVAPAPITDSESLARALSHRTRWLYELIAKALIKQKRENPDGRLFGIYDAFKKNISRDLELRDFADAFAQTLTYGLFLAKLNNDTDTWIDLDNAASFIPDNFSLIGELLSFINELKKEEYTDTRWIVRQILNIINRVGIDDIRRNLSFTPPLQSECIR